MDLKLSRVPATTKAGKFAIHRTNSAELEVDRFDMVMQALLISDKALSQFSTCSGACNKNMNYVNSHIKKVSRIKLFLKLRLQQSHLSTCNCNVETNQKVELTL